MTEPATFTAFVGHRRVASGDLHQVATALTAIDEPALIFEDGAGRVVELDLRQGPEHAVADHNARMAPREAPPPRKGRGRPRLGVVAREITLLPRHWEWLSRQPGGASAALRRLVEEARRGAPDRVRTTRETAYRVMTALGGDLPGYEDAIRALFAGDRVKLEALLSAWPSDVADYVLALAAEP